MLPGGRIPSPARTFDNDRLEGYMTNYRVIVEDGDQSFEHAFDGKPQINLTF